ncbi:uncharacterized protein LOC141562680 [Sminthopsis crassicaudata]|uniref:uncharacterized protein LOC141562680 n=1 Tax=Sminthopsis crassicaudata TaxID=9301 RepID=UPI003D68805A
MSERVNQSFVGVGALSVSHGRTAGCRASGTDFKLCLQTPWDPPAEAASPALGREPKWERLRGRRGRLRGSYDTRLREEGWGILDVATWQTEGRKEREGRWAASQPRPGLRSRSGLCVSPRARADVRGLGGSASRPPESDGFGGCRGRAGARAGAGSGAGGAAWPGRVRSCGGAEPRALGVRLSGSCPSPTRSSENGFRTADGQVNGIGDVPGCGRGLHPGGVGAPRAGPEGSVQRCDAGELPELCLPWRSASPQASCDLPVGKRRSAVDSRERSLARFLSRLLYSTYKI